MCSLGIALYVAGWRIGAIISGAIALIIAHAYSWKTSYLAMASMMLIGIIATLLAPQAAGGRPIAPSIRAAFVSPIKYYWQHYNLKTSGIFFY